MLPFRNIAVAKRSEAMEPETIPKTGQNREAIQVGEILKAQEDFIWLNVLTVVVPALIVGTKFGSALVAVENSQSVLDVTITIVVEKEKAVFGCVMSAAMNSELPKVSNCP